MGALDDLVSISRGLAAAIEANDGDTAARLTARREAALTAVAAAANGLDPRLVRSALFDAWIAGEAAMATCDAQARRLRGELLALSHQARAIGVYLTGVPWRSS
jgi:hypothetical protein